MPRLQGRIEVSVEASETKRRREDKDVLERSGLQICRLCFLFFERLRCRTPQPIKPEKHCSARLLSKFFKSVTWNYLSWSQPMSRSQHTLICFLDLSKKRRLQTLKWESFLRGFGLQALCPHGWSWCWNCFGHRLAALAIFLPQKLGTFHSLWMRKTGQQSKL